MMSLEDLQRELHRQYADGSDGRTPSTEVIKSLLQGYKSNPADWKKFIKWDDKSYTRNLVDRGNAKFNLIVLCWGPGQGSPIHDHSGSHCFVKVLTGSLKESLFYFPKGGSCSGEEGCAMQQSGESKTYTTDEVTYIHDDHGVAHRMENPSHTEGCVTLHLYTPPYSSCNKFDDRTSRKQEVAMSYHQDFSSQAPSCQGENTQEEETCCGCK